MPLFSPSTFGLIFLAFKYIVVVSLFIYAYRPVYPNRKCGQEFLVFLTAFFRKLGFYRIGLKVYYFLWRSTEYRIIPTLLVYLCLSIRLWARRIQHLLPPCYSNTRHIQMILDPPLQEQYDIFEYISDCQTILDNIVQTIWVSFNKQQHR